MIQTIGKPFTELTEVDSTNNYAMAKAQIGAAKWGETWFAHHQTKGKGSRGKTWNDSPGKNLMMSVLLPPDKLIFSQNFYITATVALSAHDLFKKYTHEDTFIKWPNDVYWRDRKAGGILIENSFRGNEWQWCIAGIGININQTVFDSPVRNAVSLKQITGKTYDAVALAKELCHCMQQRWNELQNDRQSILKNYNDVLYKRNQTVTLKRGSIVFNGMIKSADASGLLEVESGSQLQHFTFGEIEWLLPERNAV